MKFLFHYKFYFKSLLGFILPFQFHESMRMSECDMFGGKRATVSVVTNV